MESLVVAEGRKSLTSLTSEEKGKMAEEEFAKYLNSQKIPFCYIDQSEETRSDEMKEKHIRRADYIVHTKKGVFYIDVKYRERKEFISDVKVRFYLKQNEINSLFNLQNELRLFVWVAFTDELNSSNFYYTPISKIYDYLTNISDTMKEKYPEMYNRFIDTYYIDIPENFLFDCLTFDRDFHKTPNPNFIENEIAYYKEKEKNLLNNYKKESLS